MNLLLELFIPIILIIVVISGIFYFLYWLIVHKAKPWIMWCLGGILLIILGIGSPFLLTEYVIAGTDVPYAYVGIVGGIGGGLCIFYQGLQLRKK